MVLRYNSLFRHGIAPLVSAVALYAQAPQFEVSSVRPVPPDAPNNSSGITTKTGRIMANNVTLKRCIMGSYAVGQNEIQGGPDWIDTDRFEITATAPGAAGGSDLMAMLRTLLADRFKLAVHREPRTIPVYVLTAAKAPTKLVKSEPGIESSTNSGHGRLDARSTTLRRLAEILGRSTDRPVVDRTGIEGSFDIHLEWTPEDPRAASKQGDTGVSLFAAIAQQLGLRLEPQKAAVDILVIDHAERPTDN